MNNVATPAETYLHFRKWQMLSVKLNLIPVTSDTNHSHCMHICAQRRYIRKPKHTSQNLINLHLITQHQHVNAY